MTKLNSKIIEVTNRIIDRSKYYRKRYLDNVVAMEDDNDNDRGSIACSNMAHVVAGSPSTEKDSILLNTKPNIGIVSAYNDMLSAHKPLENFPKIIKVAANQFGATAPVSYTHLTLPTICSV